MTASPLGMPGTPQMTVDVRYFSDETCTKLYLSRFYSGNLKLLAGNQTRHPGALDLRVS